MPYIEKSQRAELDEIVDLLIANISRSGLNKPTSTAGLLNYSISRLVAGVIRHTGGLRYHQIAMVTGVLKNISDEFYRRVAAPYENKQIIKNSDIEEYTYFDLVNKELK